MPDVDDPARSHDGAHAAASSPTVKHGEHDEPDEPDDAVATQSASPSAAAETDGTDPLTATRSVLAGLGADVQLRNPDRYEIINEHGRGGLGRVCRAHDRDLGRDVAIKELISRGSISEVRFLREALITARLEHPGIVPVHEAGRWLDGTPFYAMKLVAGRPLRDLIAERTTVAARIGLLHHVIAVADAIAYAHGRNIIHRDLKPANVIVGDFGETIVIDWGLAKDVSVTEESTTAGGRTRANRNDGLTAAGTVLGTPAYMAPEQERGERVDQRADVFAIGAMLWELCALEKAPPIEPRLRRRVLRRAGIDNDLITIIDKALAPEPDRRYPDAGALAADLKAFKSGVRIAARSYSLIAMLAHWTRRHRVVAVAVVSAIVVSLTAATLYVRNVNIERDRAESAKTAADDANAATEAALAEQTLGHAEVLLNSDPSAAIDLLRSYKGHDRFRLGLLRAQAVGRGVARLRATPHTDSVIWLHELPGGSLATLSADGSAAVTTPTGAVTVIARSSGIRETWAFSERRQLLAFACGENEICLLDLSVPSPRVSARFAYPDPEGLAFSPDAQRLAAVSRTGDLTVWDVTAADQPKKAFSARAHGFGVGFPDDDTVIAVDVNTTTIVAGSRGAEVIQIQGANNTTASSQHHALAIGTAQGVAVLIGRNSGSVIRRAQVCDGPLNVLHFTPRLDVLAYGCKDGKVGLWSAATATLRSLTTIQGSANELSLSDDGRYLAAGGTSGVLSVIDLHTGIVSPYSGHRGRISAICPLRIAHLGFATADYNGNIKTWDQPLPLAQVVYTASSRLYDVQFLGDSATLVTTGVDAYITFVDGKGYQNVAPHEPASIFIERAPDGNHFATFGSQGTIDLWSGAERRITHVIDAQHSKIVQLKYLSQDEIVYANSSGHILRWSARTGVSEAAAFGQPLSSFVPLASSTLAVELHDGTLWQVGPGKRVTAIPQMHRQEHLMQASADRRWLATGSNNGDVVLYDTHDWRVVLSFHGSGTIEHLAISPNNDMIVIAMRSGEVHVGRHPLRRDSPDWGNITWRQLSVEPRFVAFSPGGDLLMITNGDGVVWFYSVVHDRWLYFFSGNAGLTVLQSALDGKHAATVDSIGRLMTIDLDLVRVQLSSTND